MRFAFPRFPAEFEIPDDWWLEAGMQKFVSRALAYRSSTTNELIASLTIIDAYCGVGTLALLLAKRVGKVIAIEEIESAIKDAQWKSAAFGYGQQPE